MERKLSGEVAAFTSSMRISAWCCTAWSIPTMSCNTSQKAR